MPESQPNRPRRRVLSEPRGGSLADQESRRLTGGRPRDYLLLVLSLVVLLTGYKLVIGCSSPPKVYTITDDNEINDVGRPILTPADPCVAAEFPNTVELKKFAQCDGCGVVTWSVSKDGGNEVTLTRIGDVTEARICRPSNAPAGEIKRSSVQFQGRYKSKDGENTRFHSRWANIPVIFGPNDPDS